MSQSRRSIGSLPSCLYLVGKKKKNLALLDMLATPQVKTYRKYYPKSYQTHGRKVSVPYYPGLTDSCCPAKQPKGIYKEACNKTLWVIVIVKDESQHICKGLSSFQ